MSYPLDLDEYAEEQLDAEIRRRVQKRAAGLCDYCGRAPETPTCQFPDRHYFDADAEEDSDDGP